MSKGDKLRPRAVDLDEFNRNWEYVFRREKKNDSTMRHRRNPKEKREDRRDTSE